MTAVTSAAAAFRDALLVSSVADADDFESFSYRLTRYEINNASYESTTFRNIHTWAQGYRNLRGLYRYVRDIYNPQYRDTEFFKATIWAGAITPGCIGGAIPVVPGIKTNEQQLRTALSTLTTASNFNVNKNTTVMHGTNLGDVGLRVIDDPSGGRMRLEVTSPASIKDITIDAMGFVKAYMLEYPSYGALPNGNTEEYTYAESAERETDTENVIYKTYKDGKPFAYNGQEAEWTEPYGFIPFVKIQHIDIGRTWGWSELHAKRGLVDEVNDQASILNDNIRKQNNAPALISGMSKPNNSPQATATAATTDRPQPGREENPVLWADDKGVTWTPMVMPLDIANTLANIKEMLGELEVNYPELKQDIFNLSGDMSGKALEIARQPAVSKVTQRRVNYDDGFKRAAQMAIAIGGWRRYAGYEGFDLNSYKTGKLDFSIDERDVFPATQAEGREAKNNFWTGWASVANSIPFEVYARDNGWDDEKLADFGTQKLAAIKLQQEDVIPQDGL